MWKVVGPNPHWEGHQKKMWSPLPLPRRDPVKLPFLEVTPSTVLERLRGQSEQNDTEEDRSALALWSTEPIDLSRTTPPDFGYRGVYLGKLRKGSALGRSINAEKSYSILPNKYASGGIGSARASERGGLTSPQINSPSHHRRLHSLQPLDQDNSAGVLGHHSALSKIPPLRSGRATSSDNIYIDRDEEGMFDEEEENDADLEEEEEILTEEIRFNGESDVNGYEEGNQNNSEASNDDHVSNDHEETHLGGLDSNNGSGSIRKEEERDSVDTRDSGISIPSPNPDNENSRISSSSEKKKISSESVSEDCVEEFHYNSESPTALEDDSHTEEISTAELRRRMRKDRSPATKSRNSYDSYDPTAGNLPQRGGKFRKESSNSLPSSLDTRQSQSQPFSRYKGFYPGGPKTKKSNVKSSAEQHFKGFNNYENDFELEDEDGKGLPKDAVSRMHYLKKKREAMYDLERKIAERDAQKERDERIRKYKELELRHSGNSLQITRPNEDPIHYGRYTRPSPRGTPDPSPDRQRKSFGLSLPKSKSHDRNLSNNTIPLERRPSSLERLEGSFSKLPFSRAPSQPQNNNTNTINNNRKVIRAKSKVPAPLVSETPSSRRSTPGIGLGSVNKGEKINEDDLPTACFKKPRVLNTIQGKNMRPLPKPGDIYSDTIELLKSDEWEDQVEGIETIVRMATFHPEYILRDMKEINALLMKHAKNLRSQVCRAALQAITYFFTHLKRNMEQDIDKLVVLLLHKTSDTNKFLREDSNCALDAMVEVSTPSKSVAALIHEGVGHRNPQVKTTVGRLLAYVTELLGAEKVLSQKDVADKLLPAAVKLAQEGSLEVRKMAKLIFQRLATQPQFETVLKKYVSSEEVRQIQKFMDNLYTDNQKSNGMRTKVPKGGRFGAKGR